MNFKYVTKDLKETKLTPDIQAAVEKKLTQRFKKFVRGNDGDDIIIKISERKALTRVDMEMPYMNYNIHAEAESSEGILTCVDRCSDAIDRQIAKYKTRMHKSRVKRGQMKKEFLDIVTDDELISPDSVESADFDGADEAYKIIKVDSHVLKPMDVDEAVLQMEVLDFKFIFFLNTETNTPSVVYKRDDGNIGLIES